MSPQVQGVRLGCELSAHVFAGKIPDLHTGAKEFSRQGEGELPCITARNGPDEVVTNRGRIWILMDDEIHRSRIRARLSEMVAPSGLSTVVPSTADGEGLNRLAAPKMLQWWRVQRLGLRCSGWDCEAVAGTAVQWLGLRCTGCAQACCDL